MADEDSIREDQLIETRVPNGDRYKYSLVLQKITKRGKGK